jgi:hypothetical protein
VIEVTDEAGAAVVGEAVAALVDAGVVLTDVDVTVLVDDG